MKRLSVFGFLAFLLMIIAGLGQPVMDPDCFTGQWHSADDQSVYLFQEGLIYSSNPGVALSDKESISGAYSFCKDSILLFAAGVEGLETEKELYFVSSNNECVLRDQKDGSGKVYFIRHHP